MKKPDKITNLELVSFVLPIGVEYHKALWDEVLSNCVCPPNQSCTQNCSRKDA